MKKSIFLKSICVSIFLLLLSTQAVLSEPAQKLEPKEKLFQKADGLIDEAKNIKADIYVPETYSDGMEYYSKAEKMYWENEELEDIQANIDKAVIQFEKAINDTKVASVFFTDTMEARDDALQAESPEYFPRKWQEAESLFRDAAENFEEGDKDNAKEKSLEAESLYRKVELESIKNKYLKEIIILITKAEEANIEDYAPLTLAKAQSLAQQSAALLDRHRYDQTEAAELARQAEYEINHAIYLAGQIRKWESEDQTFETVLLTMEQPIQQIASSLDMTARFDKGFMKPTQNILVAIDKIQQENNSLAQILEKDKNRLNQKLIQKDTEISNLQAQLVTMSTQLNQLTATQLQLKQKVEQENIRQEKIGRISASFLPAEGKALLDGDNVIIRLYGLTFPLGKSTIEPKYFSLLSKVKSAFAEFPNCNIIIEGHTDSQGSDKTNHYLSEERARAVKKYMIANSNIAPYRFEAVGYGESRPVATNETKTGRAMNRRIDFIIQPQNSKTNELDTIPQ